jgi:hypothetical protein
MPISAKDFENGKGTIESRIENAEKDILDFLRKHKNQAFTEIEIREKLKILQLRNELKRLVKDKKVEMKETGDTTYYKYIGK